MRALCPNRAGRWRRTGQDGPYPPASHGGAGLLCWAAMRINLIYARAANGVIGRDNAMPWHLPQDLAHFRRHTQGCPVVIAQRWLLGQLIAQFLQLLL